MVKRNNMKKEKGKSIPNYQVIKESIIKEYALDFSYKGKDIKNVTPYFLKLYENKFVCLCYSNKNGGNITAYDSSNIDNVSYSNQNNFNDMSKSSFKYLNLEDEWEEQFPKKLKIEKKKKKVKKKSELFSEEFDEKDIQNLRKDFSKSEKDKEKLMPKIEDLVKNEKELKSRLSSIANQLMGKK